MRECLEQMGGVTRKEFLIQRLTVRKCVSFLLCNKQSIMVQSEKKLWKACMVMLISWSLTWSPYALLFLLAISGQHHLLNHHSVMAAGPLIPLGTVFLAQNSLRPNILKVLPQSITGAPSVGMGKCEWGKVEFSNFRRGPPG